MVQGEGHNDKKVSCWSPYGTDQDSKRAGFMSLQQKSQSSTAQKSTGKTTVSKNSGTTAVWRDADHFKKLHNY